MRDVPVAYRRPCATARSVVKGGAAGDVVAVARLRQAGTARNLPSSRNTGLLSRDSCSLPTRKRVMDLLETPIGANGAGGYAFSMP
ncbi:MAG TPA: hypothetical protein VGN75_11110 [Kaistia sp.]|jgi:hypothetical protein|nr:hypothetical protein [Kaistia sp.]